MLVITSSGDGVDRYSGIKCGTIVRSARRVMIAHDTTSNKDCFFRGAAAMVVDISKLGSVSGKKYGEPLGDPVCVCSFEKAILAVQLIDFGDPVRPVMDCIE